MSRELTKRQGDILLFIARRIRDNFPPTLREIGTQFKMSSTNGVNDHLVALERKGYIRRPHSMASRAIQLTPKGELFCPAKDTSLVPQRIRLLENLYLAARDWCEDPHGTSQHVRDAVEALLDLDSKTRAA